MLRPLFASARCAVRTAIPNARPLAARRVQPQRFAPAFVAVRGYAAGSGMSKPEVEGRIMDLLKGFDKVKDTSKLTQSSHFSNDLGLDSLDTVEVVMAIEEEFSIEIPDKEADQIHSVDQAVSYILGQPDAH